MNTGRFLLQHVELCLKGQLDMEPWGWIRAGAGETGFLGVWLARGFFFPLFSGGHRLYPFAYLPLICQMG